MTQTRWYKPGRDATKYTPSAEPKSMLANDVLGPDGSAAVLEADGWTQDRPDNWVEPTLEQTEAEILQEAFKEIDVLKQAGLILSAENASLKSQLETALKKGGKKSR